MGSLPPHDPALPAHTVAEGERVTPSSFLRRETMQDTSVGGEANHPRHREQSEPRVHPTSCTQPLSAACTLIQCDSGVSGHSAHPDTVRSGAGLLIPMGTQQDLPHLLSATHTHGHPHSEAAKIRDWGARRVKVRVGRVGKKRPLLVFLLQACSFLTEVLFFRWRLPSCFSFFRWLLPG